MRNSLFYRCSIGHRTWVYMVSGKDGSHLVGRMVRRKVRERPEHSNRPLNAARVEKANETLRNCCSVVGVLRGKRCLPKDGSSSQVLSDPATINMAMPFHHGTST